MVGEDVVRTALSACSDTTGNGMTRDNFTHAVLENPRVAKIMLALIDENSTPSDLFDDLDTDGDGVLDFDEFFTAYRRMRDLSLNQLRSFRQSSRKVTSLSNSS